jgi:hypothetical protein
MRCVGLIMICLIRVLVIVSFRLEIQSIVVHAVSYEELGLRSVVEV